MARRRASMREGPLAELFRATEAAQRQGDQPADEAEAAAPPAQEPEERTVEHVPSWEEATQAHEAVSPSPPAPSPDPLPPPPAPDPAPPDPSPSPTPDPIPDPAPQM